MASLMSNMSGMWWMSYSEDKQRHFLVDKTLPFILYTFNISSKNPVLMLNTMSAPVGSFC
jgi:hypothetical protein